MEITYRSPVLMDAKVAVTARMRPPTAARIVLDYQIRDAEGRLLTEAVTEQVVTRTDGELLLGLPESIRELVERLLEGQDDPAAREL
jgi:acyl-CoA thioesterase FadM